MSAGNLIRFVDPQSGPIVGISTSAQPSFWRRLLWYSTAELHPRWMDPARAGAELRFGGAGWSADKENSQSIAVTEALERWAYRFYSTEAPRECGLDLDPTTNGFAALPSAMGLPPLMKHAYHEALERWALNRMWNDAGIQFRETPPDGDLLPLFSQYKGTLKCFTATLQGQALESIPAEPVVFCLCVFFNDCGGAIPGSACAESSSHAVRRAMLESYVHTRAFPRLQKKAPSRMDITEERLLFFAAEPQAGAMVSERLRLSDSAAPQTTTEVILSKFLPGPWNPEVNVCRVIVKGSEPINSGGVQRFVI